MIHWAFLVPAFVAGFVACYAFLYLVAKAAAQIEGAIEYACKQVRL